MSTRLRPSTTYRAVLGQILARHRDQFGLDQYAIAAAVGVSQSSWSRVETGTSSVSVDQLKLACQALKTTPAAILQETDDALAYLKERGVKIAMSQDQLNASAAAFVGGAALAALLLALFKK